MITVLAATVRCHVTPCMCVLSPRGGSRQTADTRSAPFAQLCRSVNARGRLLLLLLLRLTPWCREHSHRVEYGKQ